MLASVLGLLAVGGACAADADLRPARTAALVDLDRSPVGALLQAVLAQENLLSWLEREDIDKILREQELQAAFSPEGGSDRAAFGRLLKADLLVFLRAGRALQKDNPRKTVDLVVCETQQGLRLLSQTLLVTHDVKADVAEMALLVRQAVRKQADGISELYAIPPFFSNDLTYQFGYLQSAYAKVIEQMLLERKGALVVELTEAQAVARETALTDPKAALKRRLPLYLLGEFRNDRDADKRRVAVVLKLKRGEKQLGQVGKSDLLPREVPLFLQRAAAELVANAAGRAQAVPDPKSEARQLAERAAAFQRVGDWPEALALIEASLLLEPEQPQLWHDAVVAATGLARRDNPACCLRGLEHMEAFMRAAGSLEKYRADGGGDFVRDFIHTAGFLVLPPPKSSQEVKDLIAEIKRQTRATNLRIGHMRARAGFGDALGFLA